jgi:hypothetical protein
VIVSSRDSTVDVRAWTDPLCVADDAHVQAVRLRLDAADAADLVVDLLAHGHAERLHALDGVVDLVEVVVDLVLDLVVRRRRLVLVPRARALARGLLLRCLEAPARAATAGRVAADSLLRVVLAVAGGAADPVLRLADVHHRALARRAVLLEAVLQLLLLRTPLPVLVERDDGPEDGAVELLELVGPVVGFLRVALCDIQMALGVGQLLCG